MTVNQSQFQTMRQHMIESQLRTTDVKDPAVLGAIAKVARENYVPAESAGFSYIDRAIPLGEGRSLNPPLTIGRMIIEAGIRETDTVLLIGGATGYTADVLSHIAHRVVVVEESAALAAKAREQLAGRANVTLIEAPLTEGGAAGTLYDVILIDGAVEEVPAAIARQLSPSGRIIAAIRDRGVTRLSRGVRTGDQLSFSHFADMDVAPLPGFAKPKVFSF